MISVFLADDHDIVREGIRSLLENEPWIRIVGEARNGKDLLSKLSMPLPDVVLMDMNMPVMNGLECTRILKKEFPSVKILMLSMHDYETYLIDMLEAGADGYILKNSSKDELLFAIKRVADNNKYIGTEFTMNMLAKYKASEGFSDSRQKPNVELSDREMDVLQLIADGLTNIEIAQKLFTSVRTIETRRKKLLEKTGTTNTATLIRFAVNAGLIK